MQMCKCFILKGIIASLYFLIKYSAFLSVKYMKQETNRKISLIFAHLKFIILHVDLLAGWSLTENYLLDFNFYEPGFLLPYIFMR